MKTLIKNLKIGLLKGRDIISKDNSDDDNDELLSDGYEVKPDFNECIMEVIMNPPYSESFFENYFLQDTEENYEINDKLNETDLEDIMKFIEVDTKSLEYDFEDYHSYDDFSDDEYYDATVDIYVYWEELLKFIGY